LTEVLNEIDDRQRSEFEAKLDQLLTQQDKAKLIDRNQQIEIKLTDRAGRGEVNTAYEAGYN